MLAEPFVSSSDCARVDPTTAQRRRKGVKSLVARCICLPLQLARSLSEARPFFHRRLPSLDIIVFIYLTDGQTDRRTNIMIPLLGRMFALSERRGRGGNKEDWYVRVRALRSKTHS